MNRPSISISGVAPSISFHKLQPLGQGGMGTVYRGLRVESRGLGDMSAMQVALKMPSIGPDHDRSLRMLIATQNRLGGEALPGVVQPLGIVECDGEQCLAMELVDGRNLAELNRDKFDLLEAISIIMSVIRGLKNLQKKISGHGDLNFKNIILSEKDGTAKVLDFEMAMCHFEKMFNEDEVGGTFGYIAPELIGRESPSAQSDIFSLGMIFTDMLIGRHPFGEDKKQAQIEILRGTLMPSITLDRHKSVERELNRVIKKACATKKEERYQTFDSFAKDLARLVLRIPLEEREKMDQHTYNRLAQWNNPLND